MRSVSSKLSSRGGVKQSLQKCVCVCVGVYVWAPHLGPCVPPSWPPWRCRSRAPCTPRWPTAGSSGRHIRCPTRRSSAPPRGPRPAGPRPSASLCSGQLKKKKKGRPRINVDRNAKPRSPTTMSTDERGGALTEVLAFFLSPPCCCAKSGPGMQLTTTGEPPRHEAVPLGPLNSMGHAARCTSVPAHATECTRYTFFWRSKNNLRGRKGDWQPEFVLLWLNTFGGVFFVYFFVFIKMVVRKDFFF